MTFYLEHIVSRRLSIALTKQLISAHILRIQIGRKYSCERVDEYLIV
jgi:hypothetical protein